MVDPLIAGACRINGVIRDGMQRDANAVMKEMV